MATSPGLFQRWTKPGRAIDAETIAAAALLSAVLVVGLATAADYAWDPRNYNPQQAFDRALNLLYDERSRQGLRAETSWAV